MTEFEMIAALKAKGYKISGPFDPATCKHQFRDGIGTASSDGSSSFTGHCLDCGKDLSYSIKGDLADPMLQLQPRN